MPDAPTLTALLARRAAESPGATALVDGDRALDAAALDARARGAAAWLAAHDVRAGDRVAIWLENRVEWIALLFGLARLGATAVAVNTRFRADELATLLSRSRARLLVAQATGAAGDFVATLGGVDAGAVPALERIALVDPPAPPPARLLGRPVVAFDAPARAEVPDAASPDAPALLYTTSGTTRGPKLVVHAQRTLAVHAALVAAGHGLDRDGARLLAMLPLCGTFGMTAALAALHAGAPVVLQPSFDAPGACERIARHAITHAYGSDEMFARMLAHVPGERPFPTARLFGFAAFRADAARVAREGLARGVPMAGLYGSSEVQALFAVQPDGLPPEERIRAGGVPVAGAGAQVRVRDADSGALLPPGEVGGLEIRAPGNFVGYLDDAEATRAAVDADGFFRTGDIGWLRPDGRGFVYETRAGDAMRLGGFLVNPAEIESVLRRLPGVADVQVVPIEVHGRWRCAAFVVAAGGASPEPDALIAEAARTIAGYKVPARVWIVDAFPVTESANGVKVQRARLRAMAAQRLASEAAR